MENGDSVGSDHLSEGQANRLDQAIFVPPARAVELFADKVREDFRVRLRNKCVAALHQVITENLVVLDDAVVDEGKPPALVAVGVGVFSRDPAMRRPAGVADTGVAVDRILLDAFREICDAPDGFADIDRSAIENGDPC